MSGIAYLVLDQKFGPASSSESTSLRAHPRVTIATASRSWVSVVMIRRVSQARAGWAYSAAANVFCAGWPSAPSGPRSWPSTVTLSPPSEDRIRTGGDALTVWLSPKDRSPLNTTWPVPSYRNVFPAM